jgi:DNA replicative helicase MCM subunit Mcm2 (Cdc46/Mcm family)
MLDEKDPENDRKIAERVISNHRYLSAGNHEATFNFFNQDDVTALHIKLGVFIQL